MNLLDQKEAKWRRYTLCFLLFPAKILFAEDVARLWSAIDSKKELLDRSNSVDQLFLKYIIEWNLSFVFSLHSHLTKYRSHQFSRQCEIVIRREEIASSVAWKAIDLESFRMRTFHFLLLFRFSPSAAATIFAGSNTFLDESSEGEPDLSLLSNKKLLTFVPTEVLPSADLVWNEDLLAPLPDSDMNIQVNENFSDNSGIFPALDLDLTPSINNDDTEIAMNQCSSASSPTRRARKRVDTCTTGGAVNPSLELPALDSIFDLDQDETRRKWCGETTFVGFGNVPVCSEYQNPVTRFFENIYGYRCKYLVMLFESPVSTIATGYGKLTNLVTSKMFCPSGQIWCCHSWQELQVYDGIVPWDASGLGSICVLGFQAADPPKSSELMIDRELEPIQ